tara:strand:+ start:333 stop:1316 length:984 start_codon:yes stop_codon:yes gene_type:complete
MAGTVARPKVYIDYISYFRTIGERLRTGSTNSVQGNIDDVFVYNPSNTKTFQTTGNRLSNFILFMGRGNGEVSKLVESINFAGILNHNLNDISANITFNGLNSASGGTSTTYANSIVGGDTNNFSLYNLPLMKPYGFELSLDYGDDTPQVESFKIGSIIAGRSFTFPHNANLSMNINNETNIRKTRTLGGSDIVDINYYRQPLWNGYPPFVATNEPSLSATSSIGRRSWALTFSFLTQDSTFPQNMGEGFMFDNYTAEGIPLWTNWSTENITSHFMTLTLNGQLPFLFQPDDTKDVYAWCRLKSNTFSVQQSAPNLYTSKMTFEEVW